MAEMVQFGGVEETQYQPVQDEEEVEEEKIRVGIDEKELKDLFKSFSDNGDDTGTVELGNLEFIFRCLGYSDSEARDMFGKFKVDHRKAILTWSDFKKSIKPNLTEWPAHRDVKEAFRVFDQEGINYIHANQLKRFMQAALGNTNLDDKMDQLICEACEPDGDGLIDYNVFVDYIKSEYEKIHPNDDK